MVILIIEKNISIYKEYAAKENQTLYYFNI